MSHLSAERLAALADSGEQPVAREADHLAACADCERERLSYAALVAGAREERLAIGAPLTDWASLSAALRQEGLIAPHPRAEPPGIATASMRSVTRGRALPFARIAAAIALLAGGAVAGRASAVIGPAAVVADVPAALVAGSDSPTSGSPASGGAALNPTSPDALIPEYTSSSEARAALARFEVAYQHAAAYLADNDTTTRLDATEDYRTRLVALERASRTMREAMEKAPYDPVLTGYYLTTLGQREATLRQLNVAVPAGARLNSF